MSYLVKCEICSAKVRHDRHAKHLLKVHGKYFWEMPKPKESKSARHVKSELEAKLAKDNSSQKTPKPEKREPITLFSKRGTRIYKAAACDSCFSAESVVWRYAESSHGTIHIYGRCKSGLFNRQFDKKDALDLAFQGGAFESNRRRH